MSPIEDFGLTREILSEAMETPAGAGHEGQVKCAIGQHQRPWVATPPASIHRVGEVAQGPGLRATDGGHGEADAGRLHQQAERVEIIEVIAQDRSGGGRRRVVESGGAHGQIGRAVSSIDFTVRPT
jgi:hypothetical protein